MKKFLATFFVAVMMVALSPRAFAEVHIGIDSADFVLDRNQIVLHTTVYNTLDCPVHMTNFIVKNLKIYDADRNLIWESGVNFDGLNVPIDANGTVNMTFTLDNANPPNYNGTIFIEDDSLVVWSAD
ncbi:MAG: hypothetical protein SR2Q5_06035 [Quinella sp. 2Q5]|nr:hypothetical protein [Quinella sp. 2Q5]